MKVHLSLATSDLDAAVSFYSILLDAKPAKAVADYALFVTERPALELALDRCDPVKRDAGAHYGICVATPDEVSRAAERFAAAGLAATIAREESCCYANQTKVWTVDPDGRAWEIYAVHSETSTRSGTDASCCSSDPRELPCCT